MKNLNYLFLFLIPYIFSPGLSAQSDNNSEYSTEFLPGEYWWGGLSVDGPIMPYSLSTVHKRNLWGENAGNQAQPLLISNKGRYVWSEEPFTYEFKNGSLNVSSKTGLIISGTAGSTLKDALLHTSVNYFPSNGKIPDALLFTAPQYNTWIELMYDQNEDDILKYAQAIIDNGYPPGVLMIDDNWQENYGDWKFSSKRFKDPKAMVKKLHDMGFKVMLWMCPFISPDSETFRYLAKEGMLLLDKQQTQDVLWANTQNKAAIVRWWNGASALLDLSNPKSRAWFKKELDYLVEEYGVDGFKFDAGDARFYINDVVSYKKSTPNDHTMYFTEFGLDYPLNEYRASWKMAGLPIAQRLRDKSHEWNDLHHLIPGILAQGKMGYAYTCPDMIGGGEYQSYLNTESIDEELIVRSAQVHALMPMMQFSVAPWRVLNAENNKICRDMAILHETMGETILTLAKQSSQTGEPIARSLEYNFPGNNYEEIKDQFMLGTDILIAPVLEKGALTRKVVFPKGKWRGDDGSIVRGGKTIEINVPLSRLPYYIKVN
jgi:alpha-glucosidase (family GH31 glycosyl hydrolase)